MTRLFVLLFSIDVAIVVLHYFFSHSLGFFHIEKEQNLASVYSGLQLLATGVFSFGIWWMLRSTVRSLAPDIVWFFLGLGMVYMGVDEMAVIHERFGFVANNRTGLGGYYGESFNWVIYYSPAIIAAVLVFWGVIRLLWKESARLGWMVLLGVLMLFVAVALEVWGGKMLKSPLYQTMLVAEEFFEMLGETFLLTAVYSYCYQLFQRTYARILS